MSRKDLPAEGRSKGAKVKSAVEDRSAVEDKSAVED